MEDRLSPSAIRAIRHARRWASAHGRVEAGPEAIIAGLLSEEDSAGARLLFAHGVTSHPSPLASEEEEADAAPLSAEASRAVGRGCELALSLHGSPEAGTEEVLLGVLEVWDGAEAFCRRHGLSRDALMADFERRAPSDALPAFEEESELVLNVDSAVDRTDVARIVDANANRAREGLRVLEDYVRFALDDARLSQQLKECRHELREALGYLPPEWLIAARDAGNDVGREITTEAEGRRFDLRDVAVANGKRAQEAVRTLEEVAKIDDPAAGRRFEAIRYRLYSLEQQIVRRGLVVERLKSARLYWLLDPAACRSSLDWTVREAIEGGVGAIQIRDKNGSDRAILALAADVRRWIGGRDVLLIVNDRPDLALLAGADGVHLGQDDVTVRQARRIVGPDALVGVSTHDLPQVHSAMRDGADYLGVGPVFTSRTKQFEEFPGLEFVRQVGSATSSPAFCIGGIDVDNVSEVAGAGGRRVAVGQAISTAKDPADAARTILHRLG